MAHLLLSLKLECVKSII